MGINKFIDKIRKKETPFYASLYSWQKKIRKSEVSLPNRLAHGLYAERLVRREAWNWLWNKFYYEPLLRSQCNSVGKKLRCDGDIPLIDGGGIINIGDNVFIGNSGAWFVSPNLYNTPLLAIGNNTSLNYRTIISAEQKVIIGNNCMIAEETKIYDNNSHNVDFRNRKLKPEDVSPVVIGDNVWIGMNSIILKGVNIGNGSVIAAGSVVTKNISPMMVAGGNPAVEIKKIENV